MSEWGYRRDDQDSYETAAAETYGDSGYGDDVDGGRRQQSSYDGDEAGGYEKPSYGDSDDSGYGGGKTNSYGAEDGGRGDFGYSPDADRTTDESDAQERLDAIEQSRDDETTYERTEVGGLLTAAAAGGYALVSLLSGLWFFVLVHSVQEPVPNRGLSTPAVPIEHGQTLKIAMNVTDYV